MSTVESIRPLTDGGEIQAGRFARLVGFLRGGDLTAAQRDGGAQVRQIGAVVLVGTLCSSLFHLAVVLFTDLRWPYTTFLFKPEARFFDFLEVYDNAYTFGNHGYHAVSYSGIAHLFTMAMAQLPAVVSWLSTVAVFAIVLVVVLWCGVTARVGSRGVRDAYVVLFGLLSYPVLFLLDRGNLEMLIFVLLAGFCYLYYVRRSHWAWLPLALAASAKYYWIVLVVALLTDREVRQAALAFAGTAAGVLGGSWALGAISGLGFGDVMRSTVLTLGSHMDGATTAKAVQHAHSFFAFAYFIDRSSGYWLQMHSDLKQTYLVVALGIFALVVARLALYEMEPWRKFTAVLVCAIALPFESHDYTLVHLLLPLAMVGAWGVRSRRAVVYVAVFGLLLVPLDYVQYDYYVSYASLAYAVLLAVLLISVLTDGAVPRAAAARFGLGVRRRSSS